MQALLTTQDSGNRLTDEPLPACPQFSTSDPDVAIQECAKVLAPHQMDLQDDPAPFRAHVSWADLRDTSLCYMNYQSTQSFHCAPWNKYVAVVIPISGDMGVSFDKGDIQTIPHGSCAVLPPSQHFELRFGSAFSLLTVTAQTSALAAGLRRIAPEVDADQLRFDGIVVTTGRRPGTFYGLSGLLIDVVDQYRSPAAIPANIVDAMSDQAVSTFLLGLPHSQSDQMLRGPAQISSRVVKQAIDIVVGDTYAQKSVTDIAVGVGVSVRSLELGFRKEFNCTPHEYIQKFRLQRAHDDLRAARPGDGTTVTDVAIRWGFNHTGRFAAVYRRTYGTAPSETLRSC